MNRISPKRFPTKAQRIVRLPLLCFVAHLVLVGCSGAICLGEEPSEIDKLRARVEIMERQNRELIEALRARNICVDSEDDDSDISLTGGAPGIPGDDDEHIRSVVRTYLASQDKEKTKAETPAEPEWYEVGSNAVMRAGWKHGVEIETLNKDFRMKVRGRTQFDGATFDVPANVNSDPSLGNPIRNGVDFRRVRIGVEGTMYEQVDYVMEIDFINSVLAVPSAAKPPNVDGVPAPTDLYWTFMKLPVIGNLRVGNQKEPIGMEHLTSSRFLPFMERSFNQDSFYGGFNNGFIPGFNIFNTALDERMTWAAGVFKPTFNVFAFDQSDGDYSVTARVSALPWYVDEGNGLLHLGFSARQAGMENGIWRYRTRGPERSGLSQNWALYADTGTISGVGQQWYNSEAALQLGSFMVVAEYLVDFLHDAAIGNGPSVGTAMYQGGYVEFLYYLTGEKRDYNRKMGVFDRVIPAENAFLVAGEDGKPILGRGAWQVGTRLNYLDLNDKGINGGRLKDITFGLNWFLNPYMKVQWNYSITDRTSVNAGHSGVIHGFGMRLAHDF